MKKILMGAFGGLMMVGAVANADSLYSLMQVETLALAPTLQTKSSTL